jgi:hypothetical protein
MGVKHLMVSESKSKCGRLVTQGTGADCKNCARVQASQDAWAGKPAADMVAVATDVPGEPEYMTREDYATKVAEAAKPRAKSAKITKITKVAVSAEPSEDLGDAAEANAQAWCEAGSPRDEAGRPIVPGVESAPVELPQVGQWIMWQGFSYMVESRYSDGKMGLKPYGGYKVTIPDRPIAQLMAWGEVKWPTHACKTCGPRSSAWCTKCYECDHWGRPIVPGVESAPIISEGDTVYRDRDGAQGVVSAITVSGEVVVDFTSGARVTTSAEELARNCYEVISAVDMVKLREVAWQAELNAAKSGTFIDETASSVTLARRATEVQATQVAQATVAIIDPAAREAFELAKIDAVERGYFDEHAPVSVESYTADFAARLDDDLIADGTLGDFCRCHHRVTEPVMPAAIKQPIRTCMGRRKRKATKRARKQAYGMKGGK